MLTPLLEDLVTVGFGPRRHVARPISSQVEQRRRGRLPEQLHQAPKWHVRMQTGGPLLASNSEIEFSGKWSEACLGGRCDAVLVQTEIREIFDVLDNQHGMSPGVIGALGG